MATSENDIQARQLKINQILIDSNNIYKIPDYQRRYSWKDDQVNEFWYDLNDLKSEEEHFLGSIVVIPKSYENFGFNKLEVVDGQQRLTTIMLLLKVLSKKFQKSQFEKHNEIGKKIVTKYLNGETITNEVELKLELGRLDHEDYKKIINNGQKVNKQDIENDNLINTYEIFKSKIDNIDDEELLLIYSKLLKSMVVVMITANNEQSAFRLFETLNDRGLDLTSIDLMKNYLLRVVTGDDDLDFNKIRKSWEAIVVILKNINKIRFFRHYMMSSSQPEKEGKITKSKLYTEFKKIINNDIVNIKEFTIEDYIEDIKNKALLYKYIINADISDLDFISPSKTNKINELLIRINDIDLLPPRTFLLRMFVELKNQNININDLIKLIEITEIFLVRRLIGDLNASELDNIFNHLAINAFKRDNPISFTKDYYKEKDVSDDLFKEKMFNYKFSPRKDFTRYFINKIDKCEFMNTSGEGRQIKDRYSVHIEHIAPKASFTAKKYDAWSDYLDMDEIEFKKYRDRLGNLTLLENKLNVKASNNPFKQKKKEYKTSDFEMTRKLLDYDKWKKEDIEKRTNNLCDKSLNIWNLDNINL